MYRTGDYGIRRPDGEIEFRGRLDRQTKIRGQRIELDEIGSTLSRHPSIDFATAISRFREGGENQLVAYVLPKENAGVATARELQTHLRRSLPGFMVPAVFVQLHALPLSANGKIDLAMLPEPNESNRLKGSVAHTPASPIEGKVLTVVRELLENDDVDADDNFFLAGGHSLLGMQLVMRLKHAFGVDVALQQLFEAPTATGLASLVETKVNEERVAEVWKELLGLKSIGPDENFFDLGGDPDLVATLHRRIAAEFGQRISIAELFQSPTIRLQAKLACRPLKSKPVLPPGVLALQPNGTRNNIFWIHYHTHTLATAVGDDQPVFSVALTPEDLGLLGKTPTLQSIAACLVSKIRATQPSGAYTVGGFCLGGILAFEIASQLQAAGKEVSLLVMIDAPDHTFFELHHTLRTKLSQVSHLLRRLGPWKTLIAIVKRLLRYLPHPLNASFVIKRTIVGQATIEAAAYAYKPRKYEGKVLLLLASDHGSHENFLQGWQAAVPGNLHSQYLDGHHGVMTNERNLLRIAEAMSSHLASTAGQESLSCGAALPHQPAPA
jgi:thioesterase domain-containing protein/aryl carrier-like protein